MGSFTNDFFANFYKRILQVSGTTNSGVTTSAKQVEDGAGNKSCVYLSDDQLLVRPVNDESVAIFQCRGAGGTPLLQVDSTNNLVKVGVSAVSSTTQYAHFGVGSAESAAMLADTHYMIPFNKGTVQTFSDLAIGTGTDPDDNYGVSTTADGVTNALWYVPDDITIDAVHWFHAGDDATGDTVRAHLMSYSIDTSNTFRSGDMGSGVVIADGVDIVNLGYEQIYYQSMTIQSANVSAGRVIAFVFRSDSVNSDFSINATVKYHIR